MRRAFTAAVKWDQKQAKAREIIQWLRAHPRPLDEFDLRFRPKQAAEAFSDHNPEFHPPAP